MLPRVALWLHVCSTPAALCPRLTKVPWLCVVPFVPCALWSACVCLPVPCARVGRATTIRANHAHNSVNCPFFYKMGACRHGDRCSRLHHKPLFSPTILLPHMYQNPRVILTHANGPHGQMPQQLDMAKVQEAVRRGCGAGVVVCRLGIVGAAWPLATALVPWLARVVVHDSPAVPPVCSCSPPPWPLAPRPQFEDFYEEVFEELAQYGEIEAMNVCDNLGDHLVGACLAHNSHGAAVVQVVWRVWRVYGVRCRVYTAPSTCVHGPGR